MWMGLTWLKMAFTFRLFGLSGGGGALDERNLVAGGVFFLILMRVELGALMAFVFQLDPCYGLPQQSDFLFEPFLRYSWLKASLFWYFPDEYLRLAAFWILLAFLFLDCVLYFCITILQFLIINILERILILYLLLLHYLYACLLLWSSCDVGLRGIQNFGTSFPHICTSLLYERKWAKFVFEI